MLEHCGITFSWGTEFGKGGPILAAKIGPGGPFLAADRFFRYIGPRSHIGLSIKVGPSADPIIKKQVPKVSMVL